MAAITNAFALYGLFVPFSATFFIFSDYLKPSARLSALMGLKNYFIWTHDSYRRGRRRTYPSAYRAVEPI